MKYKPRDYGVALAEIVLDKKTSRETNKVVANFLKLVQKNGDMKQLPKIIDEAERIVRLKTGQRKVALEFARTLTSAEEEKLVREFKKEDVVVKKINPSLIAGVRITVDDELQADYSLARKLTKLFT